MKSLRLLFLVLLPFFFCLSLQAQSPATAPVPMPKDAKEYIRQASRLNGMISADNKSWYISATYKLFTETGALKDNGTFEEWWLSPRAYKIRITAQKDTQTLYVNGEDQRMTGNPEITSSREMRSIEGYLTKPLPNDEVIDRSRFYQEEIKLAQLSLNCVRFVYAYSMSPSPFPVYCFEQDIPALRLYGTGAESELVFDHVVQIGSQYISKQISLIKNGKTLLEVKVNQADLSAQIQESEVQAPSDAIIPERIVIHPGMTFPKKVHGEAPKYPKEAKQGHIEGTVTLSATIQKDGTMGDLIVSDGPTELRQAAVDAVKQWRYQPYLLDGKPVMVDTQITVIFNIDY